MNRILIRELVNLAIAVSRREPGVTAAAGRLIADLPRCRAPGCGVVLYTTKMWCSPACQDRAPRDLSTERLRLAAEEPLTTYTLEENNDPD